MNTSAISFPAYNDAISTQLTHQQYSNFVRKVALGTVPEGKIDADGAPLGACWIWQASKFKLGYGSFSFGRTGSAHRVSAYIAGLTPNINSTSDFDKVLHRCDNPSCVNPTHFFIGTNKNNVDDKVDKGRQSKCEEHGMAKLNWEQVYEIRTLYAAGGTTLQKLASEYGVVQSVICLIICNKIWRDPEYLPPQTRLNQEQRAEVIKLYKQGDTQQSIATQFGVGKTTIFSIIHKGQ